MTTQPTTPKRWRPRFSKLVHTMNRIALTAALCLAVFSFAVPAERFANWWVESGDLSPVTTALVFAAVVLHAKRWLIAMVVSVHLGIEMWAWTRPASNK